VDRNTTDSPLQPQKQFCTQSDVEKLKKSMVLPQHWINQSTSHNPIQVCKVSLTESHGLVVTHSVTISNDLSWSAFVHGHDLKINDLSVQFSVPEKIDAHFLNAFLVWLDECTVCPGHPDEHFMKMLKSRGGKVMA